MKNIYLNIYKSNFINLKKAKKNIENNIPIGLPTETVYGLASNAYSDKSVKKIFKLKKRPSYNPLIVHFNGIKNLKKDVVYNSSFIKLYKAFCPELVSAGKKTIAVRIPEHKVARKLLKILKFPLAAPSANISSKLSPTCANDVVDEFGSKIKFVLDGGQCKIGLESTIIDLTGKPILLRQGAITAQKISNILGKKILINKKTKIIKSPGQLKLHYSPGIPVLMNKKNPKKDGALITIGKKFKDSKNHFNISKSGNLSEAANNLYKIMRKIKKKNFKSISVCKIPNFGLGLAINDRLKKASNK